MKYIIIRLSIFLAVILALCFISTARVDDIKAHAEQAWRNAGFQVIGYEGYESSFMPCWGGKVWYVVKRSDSDKTVYDGFIAKWGKEYHVYNLHAIDAVNPK